MQHANLDIYYLDLSDVSTIYVVTDVVLATMKAIITKKDNSEEEILLGPLPIGFGYRKFNLTPTGIIEQPV